MQFLHCRVGDHKSHEWVKVCCAAQAAQEQQLQQPCWSFLTAAAWPRCKVLKPKSLRVQQCRAQGNEFLTWSQEWRRIWRCVFSPDFSLIHRAGKVVWGGIAVRTQGWRDSRELFAFFFFFKTVASVYWPREQIKKNLVRECSDSLDIEVFCKTD